MEELFASPWGALLIAVLRMVDVSMAVTRTIIAVRGMRGAAALIGFFEVLVWLFAAGSALSNLNSPLHLISYAGGFALGNLVGISLEQKLAIGMAVVRATCRHLPDEPRRMSSEVGRLLQEHGFTYTQIAGEGTRGKVDILNVVVPRRRVQAVLKVIRQSDPDAFVTVEEVRSTLGGQMLSGGPVWFPGGRKGPFLSRP